MSSIPSGLDAVTPEWLSEATGWQVDTVKLTDIGTGLGVSSAVYRAELTGEGCPPSVVVKLTATDPAAAFTSTVLNMYRREVKFFELLSEAIPVRVPECYHAVVSEDGSQVVVVMEDLGGNRSCDQVEGMEVSDAERAIDTLADWHAHHWNRVDGLAEQGAALPLKNEIYPAMVPGLFAEGWAKLTATEHCQPPEAVQEIGARFGDVLVGLLEQLNEAPITLLHGDYRADNLLFDAEGTAIPIDFQLTHIGSPAYDVAYFITQSIDADTAGEHEAALLDRWRQRVLAAGVDEAELVDFDTNYNRAALFCLSYPVIASRGMDLDDPRQAGLVNTMMGRLARAVTDRPAPEMA